MSDRASHPHGQAYLDYLDAWRAFIAPTVQAAIADLDVPQGGAVLDAGTGTGSALPALAGVVGPSGSVLGIDRDAAAVSHARDHVRAVGLSSSVELLTADFMDVVASRADAFDLIWTSDVIWPGVFSDPADTVRRKMRALKPGGRLALFYGNYYQATFLPAYPRLERSVRTASELRWKLPVDGVPEHQDRHLAWLRAAALDDLELRSYPRVGRCTGTDDGTIVRVYLESAVWPDFRATIEAQGPRAGLTAGERRQLAELLDPAGPRYVVNEPGFFILHPTVLATGRRPAGD